jgi:hypothetical protein
MFFFGAHMRRTRLYPLNPGVTVVYERDEAHDVSAGSSIVETARSVREELEVEYHLCVEKARDPLWS